MPIDLGVGTGVVSWFLDLKDTRKVDWWECKILYSVCRYFKIIFTPINGQIISIILICFIAHRRHFRQIREQVWNFPKTYEENFTIENFITDQFFNGHYDKFKSKRVQSQLYLMSPFGIIWMVMWQILEGLRRMSSMFTTRWILVPTIGFYLNLFYFMEYSRIWF